MSGCSEDVALMNLWKREYERVSNEACELRQKIHHIRNKYNCALETAGERDLEILMLKHKIEELENEKISQSIRNEQWHSWRREKAANDKGPCCYCCEVSCCLSHLLFVHACITFHCCCVCFYV